MGHKVHPIGFRLGIVKGWQSRWYAEREYKDLLAEDFLVRGLILKELANAAVSRIEIERAAANQISVTIHTARPGIVIGKSGEKVDKLRAQLEAKIKKRVRLNIMEIRQPELDAYLVARSVADQLEKRVSFRRAMKQAVQKTMHANAKGIRIVVGGRLGGAEIARSEKEVEGKIPLHTLRADIDFGQAEAHTTFGVIGVKVWIYKGDVLPRKRRESIGAVQEGAVPVAASERPEAGERRPERRGGRGERPPRGERAPVPAGERPARGGRGTRPQGEHPPRPQGERAPRGERPASSPRTAQPGQGERPSRPRGERPPRAGRPARSEQAGAPQPQAQAQPEGPQPVQEVQVPEVETTPVVAPAPEAQEPQTPPPAPTDGASASE